MVNLIERARKSAGMESLNRDVPTKRQRGAAWWARFVGALRVHQEWADNEFSKLQMENAELAKDNAKILHEKSVLLEKLAKANSELQRRGVNIRANQLGLEESDRNLLLEACDVN